MAAQPPLLHRDKFRGGRGLNGACAAPAESEGWEHQHWGLPRSLSPQISQWNQGATSGCSVGFFRNLSFIPCSSPAWVISSIKNTTKPNNFDPFVQQQLQVMVTCTSAPQNPTDPSALHQFTAHSQPCQIQAPNSWWRPVEDFGSFSRVRMSPWEADLGPKCKTLLNTSLDQSPNY